MSLGPPVISQVASITILVDAIATHLVGSRMDAGLGVVAVPLVFGIAIAIVIRIFRFRPASKIVSITIQFWSMPSPHTSVAPGWMLVSESLQSP